MPQSLAKILVHTVFSAKDRRPLLRNKILHEELHRYLGGILANLDCQPVIIGGVEDHVHLLCALSRTCEAAAMVKEVKRGSSLWLKTKSPELADFAWQNNPGLNDCHPFGIAGSADGGQVLLKAMQTLTNIGSR